MIESPPTLNRIIGSAFLIIGTLITISMVTDSNMVNPAMKIIAIVPGLVAVTGLLFLTRGNNPDRMVLNKSKNLITISIQNKTFSKAEPVTIDVNDIEETVLGDGLVGGDHSTGSSRTGSRRLPLFSS
ncbi:hypothetical protein [Salinispira pacifica]|uniref:hypothetical protein n=1 Tax=Salinispira pacifica TaxID=1307761 RepID=UPI00118231FA|nr:hypothetical protein [Salinispira pacifica]